MIYKLNGRFFSTLQGLGVSLKNPVVTITEAQRKQIQKLEIATGMPAQRGTAQEQIAKLHAQTAYGQKAAEAERRKSLSFEELDRLFQAENWRYAELAKKSPLSVRQKAWERMGKPTHQINWGTLLSYVSHMYEDWEKNQRLIAQSQATVSAAARAVQNFQAANPNVPMADAIASASRVVSQVVVAPASAAEPVPPPAVLEPVQPAQPVTVQPAAAPEEGSAPAALSLLAAGAWLLFGA